MLRNGMKYPWYAGWPLLLLGAFSAFVAWQGYRPFLTVTSSLEDRYRYFALAQQPFGASPYAREPPYVWRLLTPVLVHVLPLPTTMGFTLVTLVGLAGATLALIWLLRGLELPRGTAVAGGIAFVCLMPATGFTLYDGMVVDPLAFAFLTLALAAAVHQRGVLLGATAQVVVSSDVERVVVYAFPVIIAACCCTIESLAASWRVSRWLLWLPVFALELSWSYTDAPDYFFSIKQGHLTEAVGLSLLSLAVLCWRFWQWWGGRRLHPPAGVQI